MPRQRINHRRSNYELTADFPERLKRFQKESGLSWSEIARRLGTYRHTIWRWAEGKARPNLQHRKALMDLADSMGLGHLFAGMSVTDCARRIIDIVKRFGLRPVQVLQAPEPITEDDLGVVCYQVVLPARQNRG